ncbi:hypothetical protein GQ55_3G217100 [Panicum hallii var. hallii]|uniref:Uncharacterized protein n=1 Tax=Panicum hallii var. hallii TaxID=1504633 RepID=A0A2T7EBZ8_9POAL|nr:hypothetical protein GQ55_3G217100 [Panicum hallii var. hallii]
MWRKLMSESGFSVLEAGKSSQVFFSKHTPIKMPRAQKHNKLMRHHPILYSN